MKKVRIIILTIFTISVFSCISFADQGTTAAVFLKLEQGARPIGMGGAFTAAADDANAVLWNPAGLGQLTKMEATLMHTIWFADIWYDYVAVAVPGGEIGTFGLGVVYVNSGEIKSWDQLGTLLPSFTAWDLGVTLSYGTFLNEEVSVGVSLKLFNEQIQDEGAFSFAADIGVIYKFPVKGLKLGVLLQNLGPKFGFGEAFFLPIAFKIGVSYEGIRNMLLTLDYIQPIETYGIIALGFEYWYREIVVLRVGYQYQGMFDVNRWYENYGGPEILAGFVMGAGLKIDIYEIDYAYRQYGVLESTHRLGLTLKFK